VLLGIFSVALEGGAEGLLARTAASGHGVALPDDRKAAADALGRSMAALRAGDLRLAQKSLPTGPAISPIADHLALQRARVLAAAGNWSDAISAAIAARIEHPYSPVDVALLRLIGEGQVASGDEIAARGTWMTALVETRDASLRREIQLDIVASRQRSGELPADASPVALLLVAFPESARPEELPADQRSAAMALQLADDRAAEGRGADAVLAYREALEGDLPEADRRRARLQLGISLFGLRRYDESLVVFGALGGDPEGRYWYARSLARSGRVQDSIREFVRLAETAPPDIAHESAYLAATLLEDRGDQERAMELYRQVAADETFLERALHARWQIGWSAWHAAEYDEARKHFLAMVERESDPLVALRPRYWAARAAEAGGHVETGRAELAAIARDWPLDYYGWRAQERLGRVDPRAQSDRESQPARARADMISETELERIAMLVEAGLHDAARDELAPLTERAVSRDDRVNVGRLLVASGDYHHAQRLVVDAYGTPMARGVRSGDEALFWLSWPPAYRDLVLGTLPESGRVEPALVWSIMREESSFRPAVMSSAGAMGLLQLMPETAERTAKRTGRKGLDDVEDLYEPAVNIAIGSAYLDRLVALFPGRLSAAIGSYNAGPTAVARWLEGGAGQKEDDVWVEDIPYGQTRKYVKRVLRSLNAYRAFY
jgi:soluble lytic murein transglycosylase